MTKVTMKSTKENKKDSIPEVELTLTVKWRVPGEVALPPWYVDENGLDTDKRRHPDNWTSVALKELYEKYSAEAGYNDFTPVYFIYSEDDGLGMMWDFEKNIVEQSLDIEVV